MTTRRPTIGVFDSGFGGLTVLKELVELIPNADYLYFGDTARLPYGSKSAETVARYAVSAAHFLEEAFADGFQLADVLVLGCTHYPLLKPLLHRVVPSHVSIVDSAESTARVVAQRVSNEPVASSSAEKRRGLPRHRFFATDSVEKFRRPGAMFMRHAVDDVQHVDLKE